MSSRRDGWWSLLFCHLALPHWVVVFPVAFSKSCLKNKATNLTGNILFRKGSMSTKNVPGNKRKSTCISKVFLEKTHRQNANKPRQRFLQSNTDQITFYSLGVFWRGSRCCQHESFYTFQCSIITIICLLTSHFRLGMYLNWFTPSFFWTYSSHPGYALLCYSMWGEAFNQRFISWLHNDSSCNCVVCGYSEIFRVC